METPHVIVVPYPAQGHVIPMLELSQLLVKHGIKVTCVNTEFNHHRVVSSSSSDIGEVVNMVSIPDGLEPWVDRTEMGKLSEAITRVMPGELQALITTLNRDQCPKIGCVIADWSMAWALDVAEGMGLRRAVFCPAAAATLALCFAIPKLVGDGSINDNGQASKKKMIRVSPNIPPTISNELLWASVGNEATQKIIFHMFADGARSIIKSAEFMICNSSPDLEPGAFSMLPQLKPIGPLLASNRLGKSAGYFWPEDSSCLAWLDQQPPNSVVYVAFGSFTVLDPTQFEELALGLQLTNRPFLWVVREDIIRAAGGGGGGAFPAAGFVEGKVVAWAPQQQVLSHPSVACFVTHCGWNSTIEGISNGVPFLCWPYFAEQFTNRNYICDEWKVGLGLSKDGNGIISRWELKEKVEAVLGDGGFRERALSLGGKIMDGVKNGGTSHSNFTSFIQWIKKINGHV
ncbi:hypothetical protein C2S53_007514 [Perilla frutescens var. hirtella]|uniref:Uncharacterized protein n=1 Tax=Perilla frutescens var. hirtella TaxID=608512 RepID=A0AAD4P850_PERFH|nr:hypothetical protein C2S53_007514 [Perilla frutescens var. hirtella]